MSGRWRPLGRPRQATKELESICWSCQARLQQRTFYQGAPLLQRTLPSQKDILKGQKHSLLNRSRLFPKHKARPRQKIWRYQSIPSHLDSQTDIRKAHKYYGSDWCQVWRKHKARTRRKIWHYQDKPSRLDSQTDILKVRQYYAPSRSELFAKRVGVFNSPVHIPTTIMRHVAVTTTRYRFRVPVGDPAENTPTAEVQSEEGEDIRARLDSILTKAITPAKEEATLVRWSPPRSMVDWIPSNNRATSSGPSNTTPSRLRAGPLGKNASLLFDRPYNRRPHWSTYLDQVPTHEYATAAEAPFIGNDYTLTHVNNLAGRLKQPDPTISNIRDRLQIWQMQQGLAIPTRPTSIDDDRDHSGNLRNLVTHSQGESRLDEPTLFRVDTGDQGTILNSDEYVAENTSDELSLEPGDAVELLRGGNTVLAIHIRVVGRQAQFYTMEGEWVHMSTGNLKWATRRFVLPAELAPLLPHLPAAAIPPEEVDELHAMGMEVPRGVGASLIEKMNCFMRESNEVYRANADRLDHMFDILAAAKHLRYVTLAEIAGIVLQVADTSQVSEPALLAVHRVLMSAEAGFIEEYTNHWAGATWEIMSKKELSHISQVREWVRQSQEELVQRATGARIRSRHEVSIIKEPPAETEGAQILEDFVKKARDVIRNSRQYRQSTKSGGIGPSLVQLELVRREYGGVRSNLAVMNVPLGSFNEKESIILRFIEMWAARSCLRRSSQVSAMGPMLLRAVGMYDGFELDQRTGFTFLQEMGVLAPWENRGVFDTRLALPGHHFDNITDALLSDAYDSLKSWAPCDSMKHLRKDWGDLEVFCIDSITAAEIDDGFSLEEVEDDKSQYWIHVHIANPTAFISPEHPLSKYAARLTESLYHPEKTYPMLATRITRKLFSLGNNRPALTFSAKMSSDGEILDTRIQPSIVRNVKYFTVEKIAHELASVETEFTPRSVLTVGHNPSPAVSTGSEKDVSQSLNDSQRKMLLKLKELGSARLRQRVRNGAINVTYPSNDVSAHYIEPTLPYRRTIRRIDGDPTISLTAPVFDPNPSNMSQDVFSGNLVPDIMLLAGEIAALWTSNRGIPVLYRGTRKNQTLRSPAEYKKTVLDPLVGENGIPPYVEMREYMGLSGVAYSSADPVQHQLIGIDAYSKVTSPLRRYGDMVAHWQIEAAIRREAETGKSLVGDMDHSYLPFSRGQMLELVQYVGYREKRISRAKRGAQRHWILQAIFRAFYFKEASLPETFEVYVCEQDKLKASNWKGITKEFRLDVTLEETEVVKSVDGMLIGDWWEAKIDNVDVWRRCITMTPVRLTERTRPVSSS